MSSRPTKPRRIEPQPIQRRFARGREKPRGVVWFGFSSFWGHLRHFLAAGIATEDVDSRDWMTADEPEALLARVADTLGAPNSGASLSERLGRDLWLDFIADTGDDVGVSRAVAGLLFREYELPDPEDAGAQLVAPRGEILLFGGDTAYPVATAQEIANRVIVPFNQVLESLPKDERPRVLLGIPGNHDWYDGLDGFQRMFRRNESDAAARASVIGVSQRMLERYAEWAREFVRGGKIEKPVALTLEGYRAVQGASYFVLPLAPGLNLVAVDRQLRTLDSRQTHFFRTWLRSQPDACQWVLLPDPVFAFGEASETGTAMIEQLGLDWETRPQLVMSGDVHHYERLKHGAALHVTAGGGGAFLHPAGIGGGKRLSPDVQWPNPAQSRALLAQVPWKIMRGSSGFIPHLVLAALFLPATSFGMRAFERTGAIVSAPILITLVTTLIYALLGGVRRRGRSVLGLSFAAGLLTGSLPVLASFVFTRLLWSAHFTPSVWLIAALTFTVAVFAGTFVFGTFLALLTHFGLESTQAFTALDHPGYKHFLRIRVHADGGAIDIWCLGVRDPLGEGAEVELVDCVRFRAR